MSRILKIAAVQMDAAPAPLAERLDRAGALIAEAANAGARLVVLPELFNLGYTYSDGNYQRAEPGDGQTVTWMKAQTAQHGIHLAGSLLLIDGGEVYNSLLVIAPDGHTWRYDKNYPWAWERAYFRRGNTTTVAETDLGKFGLLICWDYGHPHLWAQYAGRVDAMIIASCPPTGAGFDVVFPDGTRYNTLDKPRAFTGKEPFGEDMNAQSAWLGVPLVNTTGSGRLQTRVPSPYLSFGVSLVFNPRLWKYLPQVKDVHIECGFYPQTKIVDAQGNNLARITEEGDRVVVAEVELAAEPPQPVSPQPKSSYTRYTYLASDRLLPLFVRRFYRRGYRHLRQPPA